MACDKILLIRHCERPSADPKIRGVGLDGRKNKESLTVRGWQRAGALVRFFAPVDGRFAHPALATPKILFACRAALQDPSLRPQHSLLPLAELLRVELNCDYFHGEEADLVQKVLAGPGPALIAWKHPNMHVIANTILGDKTRAPQHWDYERYDLVWAFERSGQAWTFLQFAQLLLAGDRQAPIA